MNKSEIAEKAAREIRRHFDEDFDTTIPGEVFDRELVQIVERAIAESRSGPSLDSLVGLLTQLRTYYIQRDDPKVANWCMRVITEAKELQL